IIGFVRAARMWGTTVSVEKLSHKRQKKNSHKKAHKTHKKIFASCKKSFCILCAFLWLSVFFSTSLEALQRVLQIPALAGRLIRLLTRQRCSPEWGDNPAFTYCWGG